MDQTCLRLCRVCVCLYMCVIGCNIGWHETDTCIKQSRQWFTCNSTSDLIIAKETGLVRERGWDMCNGWINIIVSSHREIVDYSMSAGKFSNVWNFVFFYWNGGGLAGFISASDWLGWPGFPFQSICTTSFSIELGTMSRLIEFDIRPIYWVPVSQMWNGKHFTWMTLHLRECRGRW